MPAMDDFMPHVDRSPILFERKIDDIDRPINSGAKSPWISKIDLHRCNFSLDLGQATLLTMPSRLIASPYVRATGSVNTIGPYLIPLPTAFREQSATPDNSTALLDTAILPP